MIAHILKNNGTSLVLEVEHAIFHEAEGKEGCLELLGFVGPTRIDTSFLYKGMQYATIYDHGRVIAMRHFGTSTGSAPIAGVLPQADKDSISGWQRIPHEENP
jgi:hypothetical protein